MEKESGTSVDDHLADHKFLRLLDSVDSVATSICEAMTSALLLFACRRNDGEVGCVQWRADGADHRTTPSPDNV